MSPRQTWLVRAEDIRTNKVSWMLVTAERDIGRIADKYERDYPGRFVVVASLLNDQAPLEKWLDE